MKGFKLKGPIPILLASFGFIGVLMFYSMYRGNRESSDVNQFIADDLQELKVLSQQSIELSMQNSQRISDLNQPTNNGGISTPVKTDPVAQLSSAFLAMDSEVDGIMPRLLASRAFEIYTNAQADRKAVIEKGGKLSLVQAIAPRYEEISRKWRSLTTATEFTPEYSWDTTKLVAIDFVSIHLLIKTVSTGDMLPKVDLKPSDIDPEVHQQFLVQLQRAAREDIRFIEMGVMFGGQTVSDTTPDPNASPDAPSNGEHPQHQEPTDEANNGNGDGSNGGLLGTLLNRGDN